MQVCSLHSKMLSSSTNLHEVAMHQLALWLLVQLAIGVVCACLPTYGPFLPSGTLLFTNLKGWYSTVESLLGRRHRSSTSRSKTDPSLYPDGPTRPHRDHYRSFSDPGDKVILTEVVGGGTFLDEQEVSEREYPLNAIRVKNDVEMV
jgi:hypothetical protein